MTEIFVDGFYRDDAKDVHLSLGVPFKKGEADPAECMAVYEGEQALMSQCRPLSLYDDGSVKYLFVRFMADVPGRSKKSFVLKKGAGRDAGGMTLKKGEGVIAVDTGAVSFEVRNGSEGIFSSISFKGRTFAGEDMKGPVLKTRGTVYGMRLYDWTVREEGPLCTRLYCKGVNTAAGREGAIAFEVRLTTYYRSPRIDISYRLISTGDDTLDIDSLVFEMCVDGSRRSDGKVVNMEPAGLDSTGCGETEVENTEGAAHTYAMGTGSLSGICEGYPVEDIRLTGGASNYRTSFVFAKEDECVCRVADAAKLMNEGNEHFTEVFYGSFFADRTDGGLGLCASVYQAQQNYPKAVRADGGGVYVMLVPEGIDHVQMPQGTSREQMFCLFFHDSSMPVAEIDDVSIRYQMPLTAYVKPEVFERSGLCDEIFSKTFRPAFEIALEAKADSHTRSMGMMNFGDGIDQHYTDQGRGHGEAVWINNEYDYPHACGLLYMRSSARRFLDYCIANARHQMDVDICHYSSDPDRIGGQIEHCAGHVREGVMVPSHQWVEGLLDYYHLTGDERGLESALGIGENVLGLLKKPRYRNSGEATARETGWALRAFTALYGETGDDRWLRACRDIFEHFRGWQQEYGSWESEYTDNTLVRVGFMISVAVGSLMRYYRIDPSDELKELIMSAVDDVYENCLLPNGLFAYKNLPSLARGGLNPLLMEAMATGYELSGDKKYLEAGKTTFIRNIRNVSGGALGKKSVVGDAIIMKGDSLKGFAQGFYPLVYFMRCLSLAGMDGFLETL